jgi:transformer-2 protein
VRVTPSPSEVVFASRKKPGCFPRKFVEVEMCEMRNRGISSFQDSRRNGLFFLNSSRSPSHHRTKRSSPSGSNSRRPPPNEVHRENPIPSACLGVFGLSQYTTERDLKGMVIITKSFLFKKNILDLFHKFGRTKDVQIVIDKKTNKSRGFGFVYFEEVDSATRVRKKK